MMMERVAEAHMKARDGVEIGPEAARQAHAAVGTARSGWHAFQWLLRSHVLDPSVVNGQRP